MATITPLHQAKLYLEDALRIVNTTLQFQKGDVDWMGFGVTTYDLLEKIQRWANVTNGVDMSVTLFEKENARGATSPPQLRYDTCRVLC